MTKTTRGSIEFAVCVSIGLALAYVDGVDLRTCLMVAAGASVLYVLHLGGLTLWHRQRLRRGP